MKAFIRKRKYLSPVYPIIALILIIFDGKAQVNQASDSNITVLSGNVYHTGGEPFEGAIITVFSGKQLIAGGSSDSTGSFAISLGSKHRLLDSCKIVVSDIGYHRITRSLASKKSLVFQIFMQEKHQNIDCAHLITLPSPRLVNRFPVSRSFVPRHINRSAVRLSD